MLGGLLPHKCEDRSGGEPRCHACGASRACTGEGKVGADGPSGRAASIPGEDEREEQSEKRGVMEHREFIEWGGPVAQYFVLLEMAGNLGLGRDRG